MQKQIWEFQQTANIFKSGSNYKEEENLIINIDKNTYYHIDINLIEKSIDNKAYPIFYTCFYMFPNDCNYMENILSSQYETFSSSIFSSKNHDLFRMPMIGTNLMSIPLFFNINTFTIFSSDYISMIQKIIEICGNELNLAYIFRYYDNIVNFTKYNLNEKLILLINNKPPLIEHMFEKILDEINEAFPYKNYDSYLNFAMSISGYFPNIDYANDKFYFINNIEDLYFYYYIESKIIDNFFYFMNNKISSIIDMYFIPLYYENNTIISPDLCILFFLKQIDYQSEKKEIEEMLNKIVKGKSRIEECLKYENNINNNSELKDILSLNNSYFIFVKNNNINHGILYLNNSAYYYLKYSYPNYNSLIDFNSDYFLLDQNSYYLFASFKEPVKFADFCYQISLKCFFIIIMFIIYVWAICFLINILIFKKVIIQITEPIKKLQEAIESSSTADESIFNYEYDELINELFLTCKELLSGEINKSNSEISIGNFNILSINKENKKIVDQNSYNRNLIINNDIIDKLIKDQNNMMDFSKNIELNNFNVHNEPNRIKSDIDISKNNSKQHSSLIIDDLKESTKEYKNNEEKEEKDREPYKKLFKIAEYLNFYQNKNEENYISIINNEINGETKNSIYKIKKKNTNTRKDSFKIKKNLTKLDISAIKEDNDNISVNILNKTNISYLWYREAKQKQNRSLNFKIGIDYDELFSEYIT